jgi:hypothetical protein
MKNKFIGFYELNKDEIEKIWKEGDFIFDANSLLNLYRYSEQTSSDFLQILNKIKDQIYLPHQVGLEFHSNRFSVIEYINNSYEELLEEANDGINNLFDQSKNKYSKHPVINIDELQKIKDKFLIEFKNELLKQKKSHVDFFKKDIFLDQITSLFDGKVGSEFSDDELEAIFKEGTSRYEKKIPPGYKDINKKNKGESHIYGDLIIWKQLINHSKQKNKSVVFITDDRKEDWWEIQHGKTIRPRQELISEFYNETGIRILIYSSDKFMEYAKEKNLVATLKQDSIKEVKDIRKADVAYLTLNEILNKRELGKYEMGIHSALYNANNRAYAIGTNQFNAYANPARFLTSPLANTNFYEISGSGLNSKILTTQRSPLDMLYNNDFISSTPTGIKLAIGNNHILDSSKSSNQYIFTTNKEDKKE